MTTTPTRAIGRRMTRTPASPYIARAQRVVTYAVLSLGLAVATALTPGATSAGAYLTAQKTQPDNSVATASLRAVTDLTVVSNDDGTTTIAWDAATSQYWATANDVTSGISYSATSRTPGGCDVTTTTNTSIRGTWPASADCTVTYAYGGWTSPAATTRSSQTVAVGDAPLGIALSPDGQDVYVANSGSTYISQFSSTNPTQKGTISTPAAKSMYQIAASPLAPRLAVTSTTTNMSGWSGLLIIDSQDGAKMDMQYQSPSVLYGVTYSPITDMAYASVTTNSGQGVIYRYNHSGLRKWVKVGKEPRGICLSPDGSTVYVTNSGESTVSFTDTQFDPRYVPDGSTYTAPTVPVGAKPVSVTASDSHVYVANSGDNTVSVIEAGTKTVDNTITVGTNPQAIAVSPKGKSVYVANAGSNTVSVIDAASNTVIATLPTGRTPSGVAVSPDGGTIYVTNKDDNTVSIIPTGRTEASATG